MCGAREALQTTHNTLYVHRWTTPIHTSARACA